MLPQMLYPTLRVRGGIGFQKMEQGSNNLLVL